MTHRVTVEWPDHSFTTSEEAAHIATRALSDASKALGISEPRVAAQNRSGAVVDTVQTDHLASTNDAQEWARVFMQVFESGVSIDEGLMIGWFANAMAAQERVSATNGVVVAAPDQADAIPVPPGHGFHVVSEPNHRFLWKEWVDEKTDVHHLAVQERRAS